MERLTAFEFIARDQTTPTKVTLRRKTDGRVLNEGFFTHWLAYDLSRDPWLFETQSDLLIEGDGVGKPYWNDDKATWQLVFDPAFERDRIETIRAAVVTAARRQLLQTP